MSKNRDYKLLDTLFPTIGLASFASSAGSTSPSRSRTRNSPTIITQEEKANRAVDMTQRGMRRVCEAKNDRVVGF